MSDPDLIIYLPADRATPEVVEKLNEKLADISIQEYVIPNPKVCGHCGQPQVGRGSYNFTPLCHPNDESKMDCYSLVSLHHHDMPCYYCQTGAPFPGHSHD